jgi:hypothetical protein
LRVPQVMPVGIKLRRTGQVAVVTHQDVVQPLIRLVGVAGVSQIRPRGAGRNGRGIVTLG